MGEKEFHFQHYHIIRVKYSGFTNKQKSMKQMGNTVHWEENINLWNLSLEMIDLLDKDLDIIVSNMLQD